MDRLRGRGMHRGMKANGSVVCEVKVEGTWRGVSLDEALTRHRMDRKRCSVCQGQVVIYGAYTLNRRPHVAHYRKHAGCSLDRDLYSGTLSLHPGALA
ncbi:hypothetical protein OCOJLMKI_0340 [Methylobacterium iners]|uniref:Uncharacterized protein n=1 Tax=Methylobacterium iners TaxID=418707 RepID=A0ABQ4RUC8_9HYPH|nr:hypothetical protein OCOJLMKI_0340 [Methylobacterium iners]